MAKKVNVIETITYTDDLTGDELKEDQVHTVKFGWNGTQLEIDLSKANADKLEKFLKPYVDAGRRVSGGRGRPKGSGSRATAGGSGLPPEQLNAIREWGRKKGYKISDRGRVKQSIIEEYEAAHKS